MKLFQVQRTRGTDFCSIEGSKCDYFLYEFCIGKSKENLTFKTLDYDELYHYYEDSDHTDYVYDNYASGRDGWDLTDDEGIELIGRIA